MLLDLCTMENGGFHVLLNLSFIWRRIDIASYEKELQAGVFSVNLVASLLEHGAEGQQFTSSAAVQEYIRGKITEFERKLHD
jgi:hypothetical protein